MPSIDFDESHLSGLVGCAPLLSCYDFHGLAHMQVIHGDGNSYFNVWGLTRTCLPILSVRNAWRASALGSVEPLGGSHGLPEVHHHSTYAMKCMVLRTRVSQTQLCVTFGARRPPTNSGHDVYDVVIQTIRNCVVLRTRVSQATLCVKCGARRRWAALSAWGILFAIWATKACQECLTGSC